MSLIVQAVPGDARGTALAIRLFGNRVGQVVTPAVAGLVAGASGIAAAFWLLGGLLVVARGPRRASRGEAQAPSRAGLDQALWEIDALRRALAPSMWAAMAAMAASRSPRSIASKIGRCCR